MKEVLKKKTKTHKNIETIETERGEEKGVGVIERA